MSVSIKFQVDRGGAGGKAGEDGGEQAVALVPLDIIPSDLSKKAGSVGSLEAASQIGNTGDVSVSVEVTDCSGMDDRIWEPGLEMLNPISRIYVQREAGGERGRYTLLDESGQSMLTALMYHEDECLGQYRSFVMSVARLDGETNEPVQVFDIRRRRACESVALRVVSASMYGNNISMNWSNGRLLGHITQLRHCYRPTFEAETASGKRVFCLKGTSGGAACNPLWACGNSQFLIYTSPDELVAVGTIKKQLRPEGFTVEQDLFGATFPPDLEPLTKILIIGALFHLNITYFERKCSPIDLCIIFRYLIVIGLIAALTFAAQMGIFEKIFNNKSDPEPTQQAMNKMFETD